MPLMRLDHLDISYTRVGDVGAPAVLLIHGWPDDASTWNEMIPELISAGLQVVVPTLRGFGQSRFRDATTLRTANSGILAMDAIGLMDGLGIERFSVVGHDWRANVAEALAIGWPGRIERVAMLSSPPRMGRLKTSPFWHAQLHWYQWFMATDRGAAAVRADPRGFAHLQWVNWSPKGLVQRRDLRSGRPVMGKSRLGGCHIAQLPRSMGHCSQGCRKHVARGPYRSNNVTWFARTYVQGEVDGVNPPEATREVARKFSGPFEYVTLPGVGHFPQREAATALNAYLRRFLLT